jgi:polysaccharide biosynthesis protein PslG
VAHRVSLIGLSLLLGAPPLTVAAADNAPRPLVFGVNRIGDPVALYGPPGYEEHLYRRIREVGGTCVRILASPRDIERVKGQRNWGDFDRDLELARKYEQEPIVLIANTPAWASPTGQDTHEYPYKTELLPDFADFCVDLAKRTKGKAKYFQLWNEPNGCGWHCADGFNHTDEYFPVLRACYEGIKKGNPDAVLSLGGLDDAEGHAPIFLGQTYEEKAKAKVEGRLFDAVSDHAYSHSPEVMRGKLDALRQILTSHGDGALPFWNTEYGWTTGEIKADEQAENVAEFLAAFITPAWKDMDAAVYLCIADFEHRADGFGLTDANLRPKPAFYAFQAASRFGAYPPYEIKPAFIAADRLRITFKTLQPTKASVTLTPVEKGLPPASRQSPEGTEHQVEFTGLRPDSVYRWVIETTRQDGSVSKSIRSAEYETRSPGRQLFNGEFDRGFFAGIANNWQIEGTGFCTDASLVPTVKIEPGRHAQAVFARGESGLDRIESTLSTAVAAQPGKPVKIAFSWACSDAKTLADISARAGIEPIGGTDPENPKIEWTDWKNLKHTWEERSVTATADNSLVRLFVQCRSKGALKGGTAVFMLKDVRVADLGAPSSASTR